MGRHSHSIGKRGSVLDVLYLLVILLTLGMIGVVLAPVMNSTTAGWNNGTAIPQTSKDIMTRGGNGFPGLVDSAFIIIVILGTIGILITSSMIDTNPAYFVLTMIIMVVFIILAAIFSNVYGVMSDSFPTQFPIMSFIMSNLALYVLVIIALVGIVLYSKVQR